MKSIVDLVKELELLASLDCNCENERVGTACERCEARAILNETAEILRSHQYENETKKSK